MRRILLVEDDPDVRLLLEHVLIDAGYRVVTASYTTGDVPTDGMVALFVEGSTLLRKPYTRDELREAIYSVAAQGP